MVARGRAEIQFGSHSLPAQSRVVVLGRLFTRAEKGNAAGVGRWIVYPQRACLSLISESLPLVVVRRVQLLGRRGPGLGVPLFGEPCESPACEAMHDHQQVDLLALFAQTARHLVGDPPAVAVSA